MATKIVQFRYYGKNNPNQNNNFPVVTDFNKELCYDFSKYLNKQKIIINTIPGTNIYINYLSNNPWNNGAPYTIGQTGILEIFTKNSIDNNDKKNLLELSNLKLDNSSKKILDELTYGYFIITIIYQEDSLEEKEV